MKKVKSPSFTYPRVLVGAKPAEKNEQLPKRLGGRALFTFEFTRLLQNVFASHSKLSILDISTGSGVLSRQMVDLARSQKRTLRVTAVDFQQETLAQARSLSNDYPEINYSLHSLSDLEKIPAGEFDLVTCNFALHLFPIEKAIGVIRTIDRIAKDAWIVTDFRRSRWLTMFAEAFGTWASENGQKLRDSVSLTQQTFTGREMKNLAFHAGISDYEWRAWSLLHQTLIRVKNTAPK